MDAVRGADLTQRHKAVLGIILLKIENTEQLV